MRKVLRIFLYIICGIFTLLLILVIWLNTMPGKRFVKNKIVAFLHDKLKTEVHIGELGYGLPKYVNLKDVLFRDQANDTLLYAGNLQVDINMLKLISGNVDVQQLTLEKIHAHVYRIAPDTNFNFTYIIKAFAGKSKSPKEDKPADTSKKSSLSISVKKVLLNDIHARFDDATGGTRLAVNLDHLELGMKKIDLGEMNFHVKKLDVAGLQTSFYQDTSYLPAKPDTSTTPTQFVLAADDINLKNIAFTYGNTLSKFLFNISLGNLKTSAKKFDLAKQKIVVNNFDLGNTDVKIVMGKHSPIPEKTKIIADTIPQSNWYITANTLNLGNINFVMDDENTPRQSYGMDYAHLDVKQLNLKSKKILYTGDSIAGDVQHLAVKEKSGLDLQELRTQFIYHPQGAILNNLYLQTPNTILQNYLAVAYPSIDSLKTEMQRMQINTQLQNSMVGMYDVLLFAPDLRKQDFFNKHKNDKLKLEAVLKGYLSDLDVKNFYVAGLHNTIIHVNGKLGGLPDAKKINYALNVQKIQSSNADLASLLPTSVQQQIQIPASFNLVGKVNGTITDYNTNLVMTSTDGAATLKGYVHMSPGKGRERYDLYVNTKQLNVGRILRKDSLMGAITAVITAKGQSFDANTMDAILRGDIYAAQLIGYNYRDITFSGNIAQKLGALKLTSADPNAVLQLMAKADLTQKDPAIKAQLNIDSADLQALKLYKDPLRIRTEIDADVPKLNADYPEGDVIINKSLMTTAKERYFLDTLLISSKPSGDSQHIVINAQALNAIVTGQIPLTQIGNVIQEHISRHYNLGGDSTGKPKQVPANYNLAVNATVTDKPLLHVVLPGLQSIDTIGIHATVDPKTLYMAIDAPHIVYNENTIDSARIRVNGVDSALTYNASIEKMTMPSLQLWYTTASGRLKGNEITANVSIADSVRKQRFALNAALVQKQNEQELQLRDGLVLNYKTWQVSQPNKIVFAKDGFYAQNFGFSSGNESININSTAQSTSAPINLNINNFLISNITEIVQKDTLLANGVLNTKLVAQNLNTAPQAKGSMQIQDLSVKNDTIGNLDVQLTEASANEINSQITIKGRGNDIAVNGSYFPKLVNNNNFDLKVLINALNLQSMEGLAANQIKNSSGNIKGNLTVKGTASSPNVDGYIETDNLTTTVTMLGTPYKMPHEKIILSPNGIEFDNFNIVDTIGNKATISGDIRTKDFRNMDLDMHVRAKKWQALNSTAKDNKLFYGKLVVSTNLNIKGTPQAPVLDGTLKVHDTTKLTVVIPQTQPGIEERKGIVEFVDMEHPENNTIMLPKDTMPTLAMRTGAKLDVNLAIEKNAEFNIVIDQATGDFLRVRGEAALNTTVNPDGTIGLNGTYELKSGAYELNYNLIKRKFNIQSGSTITFAGDPLQADVNITAVYTANVPPYDLVEKQVSDPSQLNYYKQRLPFDVQLKLNGPLMKPEIGFDIVLPEEKKYRVNSDVLNLVQGKLADMRNNASELNKQVFALLLLNRFVSDNPFESGAGGTSAEFIARQSASRFLSEQLNQYANQLINGFELNLDLESTEDYTTGEKRNQTNLNVSASKRLLNDRLTVTVGNDFGIEGQNQNTNQNSSLVPGNLAADYQLTQDGRYMVRIYRKDELQDIVEGYVVETGVSFIVTVEYNKFKNLFNKKKKHNKEEKENGADDKKTGGASN